jgi:CIC family chloride channel protein
MSGALISVALVLRFAPDAGGSGIPHLEGVLQRFRSLNWKRVLPVKFIGGVVAIGSGLALGREGPTVQMGGSLGDAVSRWLKVSQQERMTLITAGAGAGLAAAFNAPLSGLVFVLEEVRRDFQPIVFGAAFIAAVISDIVARIGSSQFPVFSVPAYAIQPLAALPVFAILGVAAGALGVLYNRSLLTTTALFGKLPSRLVLPAAALTGALIGLAGWFSPEIIGSGHSLTEAVLKGNLILSLVPLYFVVRFCLNILSYGTGAPGGIFAPLLGMGALLGLGIGQIAHMWVPDAAPTAAVFAVVGMAAFFTAIVRAPLTGIMLILEMTGNYAQMLPLLVSCFCAYAIAEFLNDTPIYEALLQRDLRAQGDQIFPLMEPIIAEFIIQPDAPFVGQQVRWLGLPPGCILIRISDGKMEYVPKADTILRAHMRITAVIAPEAVGAMEVLRDGTSKNASGLIE